MTDYLPRKWVKTHKNFDKDFLSDQDIVKYFLSHRALATFRTSAPNDHLNQPTFRNYSICFEAQLQFQEKSFKLGQRSRSEQVFVFILGKAINPCILVDTET